MSKPDELVLVVPRSELFSPGANLHGFGSKGVNDYLSRIRASFRFELRSRCETDSSLKQVIPYIIVTHETRVFLLRRREKQTEARLRNLFSVGVGGHINPVDNSGTDPVMSGLKRELDEELVIGEPVEPRPVGWLNDDTNAVGSVHFGIVFHVRTSLGAVEVAEKDMMEGRFVEMEEAFSLSEKMETWSQLLMGAVRADPSLVGARA